MLRGGVDAEDMGAPEEALSVGCRSPREDIVGVGRGRGAGVDEASLKVVGMGIHGGLEGGARHIDLYRPGMGRMGIVTLVLRAEMLVGLESRIEVIDERALVRRDAEAEAGLLGAGTCLCIDVGGPLHRRGLGGDLKQGVVGALHMGGLCPGCQGQAESKDEGGMKEMA